MMVKTLRHTMYVRGIDTLYAITQPLLGKGCMTSNVKIACTGL